MEDNIATDVGETLTALHRILGIGGCDNAKVIEWFQCDESSSFDYDTNVTCFEWWIEKWIFLNGL